MATQHPHDPKCLWKSTLAIGFGFAAAKLLIHLWTNGQYGYVRDEFYFLALAEHLDWGYVVEPPLAPWLAWLTRAFLGDSLFALRLLPAVAGAAKIFLTTLMVREFGGGRFAVVLACMCVLIAPGYLYTDGVFTMNAFEPLFWMGAACCVIRALKRNEPRYWLGFGLCIGAGLENKYSIGFFALGIFTGLLLTSARGFFADKWLWIGGAVAVVLFFPNFFWQYQHGWPTLEVLLNVQKAEKYFVFSPAGYIAQQVLLLQPLSAPVWIAGLWFFFFGSEGRRYRVLGVAYGLTLALLITLKGKHYYLLPAYPMLFAGGAVLWEQLIGKLSAIGWLQATFVAILTIGGIVSAPFALPIMPVEAYLRYQQALGFKPSNVERRDSGPLPQYFADMFGWNEMVEQVAGVYHKLPPEERSRTAILASNYGEAAAVDFFGPRYGLPKAISPHHTYYLWGPQEYSGETMIVLGWDRATASRNCNAVQEGAVVRHPYSVTKEHYTIFVCRQLKQPLRQLWPKWKAWV